MNNVRDATFTPIVLAATGGMHGQRSRNLPPCSKMGKIITQHNTCMASMQTLFLSTNIVYIRCIRGTRSRCGHALRSPESLVLVRAEQGLNPILTLHFYMCHMCSFTLVFEEKFFFGAFLWQASLL